MTEITATVTNRVKHLDREEFDFLGQTHSWVPASASHEIVKHAMMLDIGSTLPKYANRIEYFVKSINGKPPREAGAVLQAEVWAEAVYFFVMLATRLGNRSMDSLLPQLKAAIQYSQNSSESIIEDSNTSKTSESAD